MNAVTHKILRLSLAIGLSCQARDGLGSEEWTPDAAIRLPQADEAFDLGQFIRHVAPLTERGRQEWIHEALQAGYLPNFLRKLKEVRSRHAGHELSFWVMPDYLALGDDENYLHVSMSARDALSLAQSWNMLLPTRKMVDLIYKEAGVLLPSTPLDINHLKSPMTLWLLHEERRDHELQKLAVRSGWLQAGHMKDLVVTPRLVKQSGRAAIYGWQGTDGRLLQNLATSLPDDYADYSMGVRLIAPYALVDGQWMLVSEVLQRPDLAPLLSDEGAWELNEVLRLDPMMRPPLRMTPASLMVQRNP